MLVMSTQVLDSPSSRHPKRVSSGSTRRNLLVSLLVTSSPAQQILLKLRRYMLLCHIAVRASQGSSLRPSQGRSGFGTT